MAVLHDLRYALRIMLKSPGFTAAAVLTLALGIGANTAIFSYVDATWLRPLPVRDSGRLVKVFTEGRNSAGREARGETAYQDYLEIRSQSQALEDMVAYERRGALLYRPGEVHQLPIVTVSPNYFTALGAPALVGRTFTEADFKDGRFPVVISYSLWQQQYGADKGVVGSEIRLTNGIVTIVGVMPPEFRGLDLFFSPAMWVPAPTWTHITGDANTFSQRSSRRQELMARLRPGADLGAAQTELSTIAARLAQAYPDTDKDLRLTVEREQDTRGADDRRQGTLLLAISGMVLLIACVNVINLQLARSEARRREFATRLALGGSSGRVLRQLLTESLLLGSLGIACALLLANWIISSLPRLFATGFSESGYDFRLDARVLLFTVAGTLAAVLLFGIVPGLRALRIDLVSEIKGTPGSAGREWRLPLRDVLVASQVALSILLLVGAGLLVRTFIKVQAIDPGFNARQNMLLVDLVPGLAGYTEAQIHSYYRTLIETMNALPGVERAALAVRVPFAPSGGGAQQDVLLPGMMAPAGQAGYPVNFTWVGPDYFNVIGTRVQQGRGIEDGDRPDTPRVAVINATLAKRFWVAGDAVGKTLRVTGRYGSALKAPVDFQVVGVVEDAKWNTLTETARPIMYLSLFQRADSEVTLLLRTRGDPVALTGGVRGELMRVDKNIPMLSTTSLKQHIASTLNTERSRALLSGAFGVLGLLLSAAGIYGVLSYFISRRTREIGLRMALGAARENVLGWVLLHGMRLVAIGIAVGLGLALLLSRALEGLLFGVHSTDPLTLAIVVAILAGVALVAIYLPARRASGVDPIEALRDY